MGKNFSCNNMGQRNKSDFYQTPYALTRLLLDRVKLRGSILEPAYGEGAITHVLDEYKYGYSAYDKEIDFFKETRHFDTIITNPPYSLSLDFILKAKTVCDNFFFLLPLAYLHGKKRYDIVYSDKKFPLSKVYVFTRYPLLEQTIRRDGKHQTGMMVYAWFHWDKNGVESTIEWLDNNDYVVTGKHDEETIF